MTEKWEYGSDLDTWAGMHLTLKAWGDDGWQCYFLRDVGDGEVGMFFRRKVTNGKNQNSGPEFNPNAPCYAVPKEE